MMLKKILITFGLITSLIFGSATIGLAYISNWELLDQNNSVTIYIDNNSISFEDGFIDCVIKEVQRTPSKKVTNIYRQHKVNGKMPVATLIHWVFRTDDNIARVFSMAFVNEDNNIKEFENNGKDFMYREEINPNTFLDHVKNHCIKILKARGTFNQ